MATWPRANYAGRGNWINIPELTAPMRVQIKIRHRHEPAWATLMPASNGEVRAEFDEPQRAVTPGQSAVFYDCDEVVGGGWILYPASLGNHSPRKPIGIARVNVSHHLQRIQINHSNITIWRARD